MSILQYCLIIVLAPFVGAVIAGFFRKQIGHVGAHCVTIGGVSVSFVLSVVVAIAVLSGQVPILNTNLYTWASGGDLVETLALAELPAGDFVRIVKQLIDLLTQISDASAQLSNRAREAVALLRRGVIAYSEVVG